MAIRKQWIFFCIIFYGTLFLFKSLYNVTNLSYPIAINGSSSLTAIAKSQNVYITSHQRGGRTGHQLKDFATSVIISNIMHWSLVTPKAHEFRNARKLFDLDTLGTPQKNIECNSSINLNTTKWTGYENYTHLMEMISSKLQGHIRNNLCVHIRRNFRVHMLHMFEWEYFGLIKQGTYKRVLKQLQCTMDQNQTNQYWNAGTNSNTTVVLHARRGDIGKTHELNSQQIKLLHKMMHLIYEEEAHENIEYFIITQPENSEDLFHHGCDAMDKINIKCSVHSRSLKEDFTAMIQSDIFVMSSSSLSHWAAILGHHQKIYLTPTFKLTHDCWPQFLPRIATNFSSIDLNLNCFGHTRNGELQRIGCTQTQVELFTNTKYIRNA